MTIDKQRRPTPPQQSQPNQLRSTKRRGVKQSADEMTATQSKLEKLSFSGKDEDFATFSEQFEARMHMLNLGKRLEDKLTVPAYKED